MMKKILNLDQIYMISAKDSPRKNKTLERLSEIDIYPKIFDAIMLEDRVKGCFSSHMSIWREAELLGYKKILIFEDDVKFYHQPSIDELKVIKSFLDDQDWLCFYLGSIPRVYHHLKTVGDLNFYQCYCHGLHAYILNCDKISFFTPYNYQESIISPLAAIDSVLSWRKNCYTLSPMMCGQDFSFISNIDQKYRDDDLLVTEAKVLNQDVYYKIQSYFILFFNKIYFTNNFFTNFVSDFLNKKYFKVYLIYLLIILIIVIFIFIKYKIQGLK